MDFISFHFFEEIKKKKILYGILSNPLNFFFFFLGDMIHEKFKKTEKMLKKCHYLQQLESHFWPEKHLNLVFSIPIKVVEN